MIILMLSIILFLIFTTLSAFHFYWFFGGNWGLEKVIPTKRGERFDISIPKFATLIVALGLFLLGFIYLIKSGLINLQLPNAINKYGLWFIPAIFILRAIGDFNYVGLFKKIKHTEFANADSKVFIPLCLAIGLIGILIKSLN